MNDKLKHLPKFGFGFHMDRLTVVPNSDKIYQYFADVEFYFDKLIPILVQMEKTIEEQQVEIENLKQDKVNKVQKIEIVKFLDKSEVPLYDQDGGEKLDNIKKWAESEVRIMEKALSPLNADQLSPGMKIELKIRLQTALEVLKKLKA